MSLLLALRSLRREGNEMRAARRLRRLRMQTEQRDAAVHAHLQMRGGVGVGEWLPCSAASYMAVLGFVATDGSG